MHGRALAIVKLVRGNGKELEVFDVTGPVYRIAAREGGPPVKYHGWRLLDEDAARALLQELRATGAYDTGKPA